ncbi:MAG: hypothetical protein ACRC6A_07060 [Fusobacteriaceae bacterium]
MKTNIKFLIGIFLLNSALSISNPGKNGKPHHNNGNSNNNSFGKPMDKTHPSILNPNDWKDDKWYGDDDYYKKNWGYSKDSFRKWLERNPSLNKKDRKSLEKLYKDQLKHEKRLRKEFSKYNHEISTLPAYRGDRDPMGSFIEDYLYNRNKVRNYNFSNNFRNELSKEEKTISDFFRFVENFK